MQLNRLLPYVKVLCAAFGFLAACRADGCFFYLLLSAALLVAIIMRSHSLPARPLNTLSQPLLLLLLYQALVFAGEIYRLGFTVELRAAALTTLNVPLLFIAGSFAESNRLTNPINDGKLSFAAIASIFISFGAIFGSLVVALAIWLSDSKSIVALRPSENLFVVGIALLMLVTNTGKHFNQLDKITKCRSEAIHVIGWILCVAFPVFTWLTFKGSVSLLISIAFVASIVINEVYAKIDPVKKFQLTPSYIKIFPFTLAIAVVISITFDSLREIFLRYLIYPFVTANPLNGRLRLIDESIGYILTAPLIGQSSRIVNPNSFWSHNFIIDTIIFHGWFAAFFILAFGVLVLVFLSTSPLSWNKKCTTIMAISVLYLGALLQPVEFADGVAFQLSFYIFGIIWGIALASYEGFHSDINYCDSD